MCFFFLGDVQYWCHTHTLQIKFGNINIHPLPVGNWRPHKDKENVPWHANNTHREACGAASGQSGVWLNTAVLQSAHWPWSLTLLKQRCDWRKTNDEINADTPAPRWDKNQKHNHNLLRETFASKQLSFSFSWDYSSTLIWIKTHLCVTAIWKCLFFFNSPLYSTWH